MKQGGIPLNENKTLQSCCGQACMQEGEGRLPHCAPLANPYVPFQQTGDAKYEARRGLIRGTIFPGLDLPFMGMVNTQEKSDSPMHELQALAFAIQELTLYMDTHREDREALELLRAYQKLYQEGTAQFQSQFGPTNSQEPTEGARYLWLENPWPWELAGNQE